MAVTTFWYAPAFIQIFNKLVDWNSDTLKATLHTSSYTPNQDTHNFQDDLTNELSTANGYTAGGDTVVGSTPTNTNNVINGDSDDPQWTATGAGFTARILVLADTTPGSAATNPLLLWSDFGQNETASGGGTFTYAVHASGFWTITAADATGFP